MLKTRTLGWVAWSLGFCVATAQGQERNLAEQARSILEKNCHGCHGHKGSAKGGFGYLLDRDQLIRRGKVVPGNAGESELYQRVQRGEMPPAGKLARPSQEDIALLKRWIEAGTPVPGTSVRPPEFLSDAAMGLIILEDLETLEPQRRRYARYFTFTHLANAGANEESLQTVRQGLSKLINSLSWHARITRPRSIDPAQTIYRIDVRDYKWTIAAWDRMTAVYPYRSQNQGPLVKATGCEQPVLRADWFVATASRPPLYYDLLQMPVTERGLERLLQVDVLENLKEEMVVRAGFNDSGVSKNNRLIERHDAAYGAYWRSYDFAANTGRQNLFEHPLGPNSGEVSFAHAGGEMIFHLPNGLHGFLLTDGQGRRLDKAPNEIVADPRRPDQRVEAGLSCMSCHSRGLIPKADQVRGHVDKNPAAFAREVRDKVHALYPPRAKMQALLDEDNERFVAALAKMGIPNSEEDPVTLVTLRYEATLDRTVAAAELGLKPEEFSQRLAKAPSLLRLLGPLNLKEGTVQRQVFQEGFLEIARALRWGKDEGRAADNFQPFTGHTASILCVTFSPDGKLAASGSADKTVRIWEAGTGKERQCLQGFRGEVAALAFTPDGEKLLTGGQDGILRLWNLQNGEVLVSMFGHTEPVRCLAISRDGRQAVSSGNDQTIRWWDLTSGKELGCFRGHTGAVSALAFGPGRHQIVSASLDGTVRLWDMEQGRELRRLEGHQGEVYAVAISADGRHILSGGNDRTIRLWDAQDGQELRCFKGHANAVIQVAFGSDQRTIISASSQYRQTDRVIRFWDLGQGSEVNSLGREGISVGVVAFSADGRMALSGGSDSSLFMWKK